MRCAVLGLTAAAPAPPPTQIWLQLEVKRIPYIIEKENMRCYGPKSPKFLAKVRMPACLRACMHVCACALIPM